jgi:isocitrate/isopropylmalate dehydrogenase
MLEDAAGAVESAVVRVLEQGYRTADIFRRATANGW